MTLKYKFYKIYEFFKYNFKWIFKNLWFFRKEIYYFRPWDYRYTLGFLRRSLESILSCIEEGHEELIDKNKKVVSIKEVIKLLKIAEFEKYLEEAKKELNIDTINKDWTFESIENSTYSRLVDNLTEEEREHNNKIFKYSWELEERIWDRIFYLLKGQGNMVKEDEYDGSGIKGWWT